MAVLLIVAVAFFAYANTFHVPFQFDDGPNISENPDIQVKSISLREFGQLARNQYKETIRVVAFFTFALNYYFGGLEVFGYHLVNLLIHIASGLFLYAFLLLTLNLPSLKERYGSISFPVALFSSLLFISHPIQTQSVTYIVQRMASMAGMFYLLAMVLYVKGRLSRGAPRLLYWTGMALCYLLGLFTKENVAILPLFVALYELYFFQNLDLSPERKRTLLYLAGVVLAIGLVMLLAWGKRYYDLTLESYRTRDFTLTERVLTQFRVVLYYVTLLIYPHPSRLNLDYDFPISRGILDPPTTLLAILTVVGLLGYSAWSAKKRPLLSYFILWYFGNLVIESSIFPLEMVFEHRLYLPVVGPFVLFALLVVRGWEGAKGRVRALEAVPSSRWHLFLWVLVLGVTGLLCLGSYTRNRVWRDPIALWEDCVKKSLHKNRPHYNLGLAYFNAGRYRDAIDAYQEAIHLKPDEPDPYVNLGRTLQTLGSPQEAIQIYEKALRLKPGLQQALHNLGIAYVEVERYPEAIETLERGLSLRPRDPPMWNFLGVAFRKTGRPQEAVRAYQEAIRLNPSYAEAYYNLGLACYGLGRYQEAVEAFRQAIRLQPENEEFYYNLGVALTARGDHRAGIEAYQKAIRIKPGHVKARFNLALSYWILKERNLALEQYEALKGLDRERAEKLLALMR